MLGVGVESRFSIGPRRQQRRITVNEDLIEGFDQ
jgi:hypothetical protein